MGYEGLDLAVCGLKFVVHSECKHAVCQLCLMIPSHLSQHSISTEVCRLFFEVLSLELGGRSLPSFTAMVDNTCFACGCCFLGEERKKFFGQEEVREVVDSHLSIKTVFSLPTLHHHDPRVVAEDVDAFGIPLTNLSCSFPDTLKRLKVTLHHDDLRRRHFLLDALPCFFCSLALPVEHEHGSTFLCTGLCSNVSCSCGTASDGDNLAGHGGKLLHHLGEPFRLSICWR
mmetsp:Transcript_6854/g.24067  ORF Transcript_6854/g.24067 Transcript_6854/m.24067 type:complete len:229 (+) Transcript_6854:516-1202(+)